MSTKTYRSRIHRTLSLTGQYKDKKYNLNFINGNDRIKCVYTTNDEQVQQFIESTDLFKQNLIYIEQEKRDEPTPIIEISHTKDKVKELSFDLPDKECDLIEKTFKNKQELIEQITMLLPEAKTNKKMPNSELIEIGKKGGYLFIQE